MPSGMQMWDPSGNLIIDTSMHLGRILGIASLSGPTNGSQSNSGLATGTPFWILTCLSASSVRQPVISVSGTTISWDFEGAGAGLSWRLVYGVY